LAESLRIFSDLAVGETAAILSAAKVECGGAGMPPLLNHWKYQWWRHRSEGEM